MNKVYDERLANITSKMGIRLSTEELNWLQEEFNKDKSKDTLANTLGRIGHHLSVEEIDMIMDAIKEKTGIQQLEEQQIASKREKNRQRILEMARKMELNLDDKAIEEMLDNMEKEEELLANRVLQGVMKNDTINMNGQQLVFMGGLPEEVKDALTNPDKVEVWADSKHRGAILNPKRVIINDNTNGEKQENVLIITEGLVYEITIEDNKFRVAHTKIGEKYNEFGRLVEEVGE